MITIEELEQDRIKLRKNLLLIGGITLAVFILLLLIFQTYEIAIFAIPVTLGLPLICTGKQKRDYILKFKKYFVQSALKTVFTDLTYRPEQGMPRDVISSTKMMHMGDRYTSNDYISGRYKDIGFRQADIHIEEERETTDSDGNTRTYWVTLFKGRWMIFDFNKTFKADLQVCQKYFGNNKISNWGNDSKFEKVKLESMDFNKRFNVYAQSDHEAFYLLTPPIMEKIIKLDDMNQGRLLLCFIDNKLHIGLYDGKDSFEHAPIFKQINEEQVRSNISNDIKQITMFIDELDLDNDLFRREAK